MDSLESIFGGALQIGPLHSGISARFLTSAATIFADQGPIEFPWFETRESSGPNVLAIAVAFANAGWHYAAWTLVQLHYDQVFKKSVQEGKGRNLGHALWGTGQLAHREGHRSAARHYTALATIGDVIWNEPEFRGAAPHALANDSDWSIAERFIGSSRDLANKWSKGTPICPEAILAAQWFAPDKAKYVLELAPATEGLPFSERLLRAAARTTDTNKKGALLEAATALLLSSTPGFEVRGTFEDVSSQTDRVLTYRADAISAATLPEGYVIVECKHAAKAVDAKTVREFGARCILQGAELGILVAARGIAGRGAADAADPSLKDAERERDRLMARGAHILVLSVDDLRGKSRDRRSLEPALRDDYERLRFGVRKQ